MTDRRPDTDERDEPGGTPSTGQHDLTAKPAVPGTDDAHEASAVPGAYASEDDAGRGRAGEPGA